MSIVIVKLFFNREDEEKVSSIICDFKIEGLVEIGEVVYEVYLEKKIGEKFFFAIKEYSFIKKIEIKNFDENKDWVKSWKDNYEIVFLKDVRICPPWIKDIGKNDIVINPAMGFGTGKHETTKIAANLINEVVYDNEVKSFLDVGSGSGILSFFAEKKKVRKILGIDISIDAVENAVENKQLNYSKSTFFKNITLKEVTEKYDLVCANIVAEILLDLKNDLKRCTKKGGYLVISGIHEKYINHVKKSFSESLSFIKLVSMEEWRGLLFKNT